MDRMTEINARIGELSTSRDELNAEVQRITELNEPTEGELQRGSRQMAALEKVDAEIGELKREQRGLLLEIARSGAVENGGPQATPRRGPDLVSRGGDPWVAHRNRPALESGEVVRSDALRAIERVKGDLVPDDGRELVRGIIEDGDPAGRDLASQWALVSSDPLYRSAFNKIVANPTHGYRSWSADELAAYQRTELVRTAMSLSDAAGGYLVPFTLDPTIILTNAGIVGPLRSISTRKTTVTDTWSGVTSAGVTAEWLGEGVEAADATPTVGQLTITPKKAAAWVYGSYEVLSDSNFASQLGKLLADAKVRLDEAAFATGNTGATIPRGVVAAVAAVTASIVTASTISQFGIADLYRTHDAVEPRGSESVSWIANRKIFSKIRQFDTAGSGSFWANLGSSVPNQLLGEPRYECSTMEAAVTTSGSVLLLGDFSEYYVVDRLGATVLYEPMVKGASQRPTGQAGWFGYWRTGADVADAAQFRLLRLHTTATAVPLA